MYEINRIIGKLKWQVLFLEIPCISPFPHFHFQINSHTNYLSCYIVLEFLLYLMLIDQYVDWCISAGLHRIIYFNKMVMKV